MPDPSPDTPSEQHTESNKENTTMDNTPNTISIDGTGYLARCLLHETDHLSGIVLEDRLSARARALHRRAHAAVAEEYGPDWPAR